MAKQDIVIIRYNAGNIRSVKNALLRLDIEAEITGDPDRIRKADKVIFPGVGEASTTMTHLNETLLSDLIRELKQPVLGICLGMQLMGSRSEEGDAECLNIFDQPVVRFQLPTPNPDNLKIPHMGWNRIFDLKGDLFDASMEGGMSILYTATMCPLATIPQLQPFISIPSARPAARTLLCHPVSPRRVVQSVSEFSSVS